MATVTGAGLIQGVILAHAGNLARSTELPVRVPTADKVDGWLSQLGDRSAVIDRQSVCHPAA